MRHAAGKRPFVPSGLPRNQRLSGNVILPGGGPAGFPLWPRRLAAADFLATGLENAFCLPTLFNSGSACRR
ncbi:hypothetical protein EV665_102210 [Shinella granuli]|uniref:Uncharacterized protein n=1 Tax=Shinella granuli TaxID=323621 RepID=A0A4R2D1P7_SHIGR|nr:hypothetical protein EV665_102210 [Shinella granuli]